MFMPKETKFFDLFDRQIDNVVKGAKLFREILVFSLTTNTQTKANERVYVRRSKFKMIFNFSLRRRVPRRTWSEATSRYFRSRKIKKHLNLQEHAH